MVVWPMTHCIAVSGFKHTGKTMLVERLTEQFTRRGRSVAVMKRDVHGFAAFADDRVDTGRLVRAGAARTLIVGQDGHLGLEIAHVERAEFTALVGWMAAVDVLLLEGFKDARVSRVVLLGAADLRQGAMYVAPEFARAAWERGELTAWVVPGPPFAVGGAPAGCLEPPVYLRDDAEGIADRIELAFREGAGRFDAAELAVYALRERQD